MQDNILTALKLQPTFDSLRVKINVQFNLEPLFIGRWSVERRWKRFKSLDVEITFI